jgi:uncharacterized protein (DUF1330 family)
MSAYVIASVEVTNPEKYEGYKVLSGPAVAAAGGKFVVRGGAIEVLEGAWPRKRLVVIEFASMQAARAFYESALYEEARHARAGAADFNMIIVDGVA